MNNRFIAVICRVVGIIYAVLLGIVAIGAPLMFLGSEGIGVGLLMAVLYGVIAFISLAIFWGFANILNDVDDLKEFSRIIMAQNRRIMKTLGCDEEGTGMSLSAAADKSAVKSWRCAQCGYSNSSEDVKCKGCGSDR